jgi:hypothetical protein
MKRFFVLCVLVACADHGEPPLPDAAIITGAGFTVDKPALDFGVVHCGNVQTATLLVTNKNDVPITVDLSSNVRDIQVAQQVTIGARQIAMVPVKAAFRTRAQQTGALKLSADGKTVQVALAIAGDPTDAQVVFTPAILDFGKVLPNTTKDLKVTATSDGQGRATMTLGEASTPRFALVGTASALVSTVDTPTFTIRLTAGDTPIEYTGTLPVSLPLGICAPATLDLRGTVVP